MKQFRPKAEISLNRSIDATCSQLSHWPVQLKLVSPGAPFLYHAHILVCADCVPFAIPDFHAQYLAGKVVLVGCPKLDDLKLYFEKLTQIFAQNQPAGITVLKMQVPCCSGIAQATMQARSESCPGTPIEVITFDVQGEIIDRQSHRKSA